MSTSESLPDFLGCGVTVRLAEGGLGIVTARMNGERTLLSAPHGLRVVRWESIEENPARCPVCGQASWWWKGIEFQPWCLVCKPPDCEWRQRALAEAQAFVDRVEGSGAAQDMEWARRILDAALTNGGRTWEAVQKISFAGIAPVLLDEWSKQEKTG